MFSILRLFGLELNIDGTGTIAPPVEAGIQVRQWSGTATRTEARVDAWLEIGAFHTVRFSLRLKIEASISASVAVPSTLQQLSFAGTTFLLQDRLFASLPGSNALVVKTGGIRFSVSPFPAGAWMGENGALVLTTPDLDVLTDGGVPFSIFTGPG